MLELKGMPVVKGLNEKFAERVARLRAAGAAPKLAVVRVGCREDDLSYEKGIIKRFEQAKAEVKIKALPADTTQEALENALIELNLDPSVHAIIVFRPLPRHLSLERLKKIIAPEKDADCMGTLGNAYLFEGNKAGFPPCTPQAVIELLEHYNIPLAGKKAVVVGRSLVVGKPLAVLLLEKNATVTVCHTKTADLKAECKSADILIACAGVPKMITADHVGDGQVIIDVGINMLDGKLCGDVDFDAVKEKAFALTPVPGGVGSVTTSVLLKHTINAASAALGSAE